MTATPLSDGEYLNLYTSLQVPQQHVCNRQCHYKQVCGNLWLCSTSGSAHVCDQNCNQRIQYDNHTDICRLSKRLFPRGLNADLGGSTLARKRSSEGWGPAEAEGDLLRMAKRSQSGDGWAQDAAQAAWAVQQQQEQPTHQP